MMCIAFKLAEIGKSVYGNIEIHVTLHWFFDELK